MADALTSDFCVPVVSTKKSLVDINRGQNINQVLFSVVWNDLIYVSQRHELNVALKRRLNRLVLLGSLNRGICMKSYNHKITLVRDSAEQVHVSRVKQVKGSTCKANDLPVSLNLHDA